MSKGYRVKAIVNLDAIYENMCKLKAMIPSGTKMCAVIKTDGYGHGAVPIAKKVHGVADWFAVATTEEALELRDAGVMEPILILGFTQTDCFETLIEHEIRPTIYEVEDAKILSQVAKKLGKIAKIHIKLDTGMGRLGFWAGDKSTVDKLVS